MKVRAALRYLFIAVGSALITVPLVALILPVFDSKSFPPPEGWGMVIFIVAITGLAASGLLGCFLIGIGTRGGWLCLGLSAVALAFTGVMTALTAADGSLVRLFDLQRELEFKLGAYVGFGILAALIVRGGIRRLKRQKTEIGAVYPRKPATVIATICTGVIGGVLLFVSICYSQGVRHVKAGRNSEGIESLMKVYRFAPWWEAPMVWLGQANLSYGSFQSAGWWYRRALKIYPNSWMAKAGLGTLYISQGVWADALEAYQEVLAIKPDEPTSLLSIASVYLGMGRLEEAKRWVDFAARNPKVDRRSVDLLLGQIAFEEDDLQGAEQRISRLLGEKDLGWAAYSVLGKILNSAGRFEEATQMYERALKEVWDSRSAKGALLLDLGHVLASHGQFDAAKEKYQQALRWQPNLVAAHQGLAYCASQKKEFDLAIYHLNKLLEAVPGSVDARAWLAVSCGAKADVLSGQRDRWGDRDDLLFASTHYLKEVIALQSSYPDVHYLLARAYLGLGHVVPCLDELQKQLKIDPHHSSAKELHQWLLSKLLVRTDQTPGKISANLKAPIMTKPPLAMVIPEPRLVQERLLGSDKGTSVSKDELKD